MLCGIQSTLLLLKEQGHETAEWKILALCCAHSTHSPYLPATTVNGNRVTWSCLHQGIPTFSKLGDQAAEPGESAQPRHTLIQGSPQQSP